MARSLIPRRRSDRSDVATLLDRFWNEPLTPRTLWGDLTATDIRVDMYEEDDTIVVEAEVPGLAREDLHLEIHGDEGPQEQQREEWGQHAGSTGKGRAADAHRQALPVQGHANGIDQKRHVLLNKLDHGMG